MFLAAGVVWGLSTITRPNILVMAPVIFIWFWINGHEEGRWRHALKKSLLVGLGAALIVLPVTLRNRVVGGEWVLVATNGGVNFYIGNNPESDGTTAVVPGTRKSWKGGFDDTHRIVEKALGRAPTEVEVSDYWYGRALRWIVADPTEWGRLTFRKFRLFWSPYEIGNNQSIRLVAQLSPVMQFLFWLSFPVIAALAGGGLFLERRRGKSWFLVLAFAGVYMGTVVAFFSNARYRLPVVPILILAASAGIVHLLEVLRNRDWTQIGGYLAVIGLTAGLVVSNPPGAQAFHRNNEANYFLQLGQYYRTPPPSGPGDDIEAARCFRRATQLWPRHPEARLALGRVLAQQGKSRQAVEQFSIVVEEHPGNLEAKLLLGRAQAWAGDFTEALNHFQEAVQLSPASAEAHQGMGCVLGALGRPAEALPHLRKALSIEPNLPRARQCLQQILGSGSYGSATGSGPPG